MKSVRRTVPALVVVLSVMLGGCSSGSGTRGEEGGEHSASRGEHDRDGHGEHSGEHSGEHAGEHGGEHVGEHGGEGHVEESGTELGLDERYDNVRNGARLILAYDRSSNSFTGTVENTTQKPLERVRVEVHLSNGKELGPTTPKDLAPGEKMDVKLVATSTGFDGWSAHPEVGNEEHGHGGEGEHDEH